MQTGFEMTTDFQELRVKMVDGQVRTTDVTEIAILSAMLTIAREKFVPQSRVSLAYIDEDIEVTSGRGGAQARYLMEPSPFARLVQLAEVRKGDRVLDVGCNTGYSSAVFAALSSSVVALESDAALAETAKTTLNELGLSNVNVVEGALAAGYAASAPYDVIFINGAVDVVPQTLLDQLAEGGRLVTVVGRGNAARATLYIKENGLASARPDFNAAVKPLAEFQAVPEFKF